jgi:hypothetical protein
MQAKGSIEEPNDRCPERQSSFARNQIKELSPAMAGRGATGSSGSLRKRRHKRLLDEIEAEADQVCYTFESRQYRPQEITVIITEKFRQHVSDIQGLPRFFVNVRWSERPWASHPLRKPEFQTEVREWCEQHCSGEYYVAKAKSVHFQSEEDAVLFWMTFKSN